MNNKTFLLSGIIATIAVGCILQHFLCCGKPISETEVSQQSTSMAPQGDYSLQAGESTEINESASDVAKTFVKMYNQNPLTISFGLGQVQAFPTTSDSALLRELCEFLLANPDFSVTVNGYGDSTGTIAGNLAVTRRRAENVKTLLVAEGISKNKVTAIGMAAENPVGDNQTSEGRALNRRVEVVID